jgi:hypothetical protein
MNSERDFNAKQSMFRTIRNQIRENKRDFPEQYSDGFWELNNSSIEDYKKRFSRVGGEDIDRLVRNAPSPVAIDFFSGSEALAGVFGKIPDKKQKLGVVVSLHDIRDEKAKERDEKLGIKQVVGDVLRSGTWQKIKKELGGRKADLIMESGGGGLCFLPLNRHLYSTLVKRTWDLLSSNNGTVFLQVPHKFDPELGHYENERDPAKGVIWDWLKHLSYKKITSSYRPLVNPNMGNYGGILKLVRSPKSPEEFPMPSLEDIDRSGLPAQKVDEISASVRNTVGDIFRWVEWRR